jgi:hypothetical protein
MMNDHILKYIIKDFRKAVEILVKHQGEIRFRLRAVKPYLHYDHNQVPKEYGLQEKFVELHQMLTKYPAKKASFSRNGIKLPDGTSSSVDETLYRIRSDTASKIAQLIFYIHLSLEQLKFEKDIYLI